MPHLLQPFTAETDRLTQLVLQCHPAQQLYLLGSIEVKQRTTTVFRQDHPSCTYTSHYFLLSLVQLEGPHRELLQDKIENTLAAHFVPTTVLVLNLHTFNRWLAEGQGFACTILRKAGLLHDRGYELINHNSANSPPERFSRAGKLQRRTTRPAVNEFTDAELAFGFHRQMAKQFWDGAAFFRQKGSNDLAALMLHQCTEQCLRCLLKVTTGWCPHTHNIDKLVRYCSMTVYKLTEIFHNRTPEQARLYRLLRNAYIDARYKRYVVLDDDIARMSGKVRAVMQLLNAYGKEGIRVPVGEDTQR